jgi:hypothetical protein
VSAHPVRVAGALVLCASTLLACGGVKPEKQERVKSAKDVRPDESTMIIRVGEVPANVAEVTGKVWTLTSRARHLAPKAAVKLAVLPGRELVAVVKAHVASEIPPAIVNGEGRCYAALGLIPYDYDYEAETYALLEEQLAGLYMPEDKTMYVAKGLADEELVTTLAHELVHALQDQHFSIGARMKYSPDAGDALGALQSLAEGDATSAMLDALILAEFGEAKLAQKNATDLPDRDAEDLLKGSIESKKHSSKIAAAPRFLAVSLLAPYAEGLRFVNALRRRGGWKAVDAAFEKAPTTTEQVLHIGKYFAHEPAIKVAEPTAAALGSGWRKTFSDVFGESEGRIAFTEWMSVELAKPAAAGWGGDHVALFEGDGDHRAVAWHIVFDSPTEANEAWQDLTLGWAKAYGTPQTSGGSGYDLQVFGMPPPPAAPAPPVAGNKKPDKLMKNSPGPPPPASASTAHPLPQLPQAPGSKPSKPPPPVGCRALLKTASDVVLIGGAPCAKVGAWAREVGKAS